MQAGAHKCDQSFFTNRIGRLNVEAAEKFGIYGAARNDIKSGLSVTNREGETITPEQVTHLLARFYLLRISLVYNPYRSGLSCFSGNTCRI